VGIFAIPAIALSRQAHFQLVQVWYLSVATVAIQAVVSLTLLRWQLQRRLHFSVPPPVLAPGMER
jgi:hypothetical protein